MTRWTDTGGARQLRARWCATVALALGLVLLLPGCFKPDKPSRARAEAQKQRMVAPESTEERAAATGPLRASVLDEAGRARPVARIGGRDLTLGELEARFGRLPRHMQYAYSNPEQMQRFLALVVDFEVLAAAARRDGLLADPAVIEAGKLAMVQTFLREAGDRLIEVPIVTADDVHAEYDAHPARYERPFVVKGYDLAADDRTLAEGLRRELVTKGAGDPARTLAAYEELLATRPATDPARGEGGAFEVASERPSGDGGLVRAIRDAALALAAPGAVSPVVEVGTRFHVLVATARDGGGRRPLQEVEVAIRRRLYEERRGAALDAYVAARRAEADVHIDATVLARVRPPAARSDGSPGLPSVPKDGDAAPDTGDAAKR